MSQTITIKRQQPAIFTVPLRRATPKEKIDALLHDMKQSPLFSEEQRSAIKKQEKDLLAADLKGEEGKREAAEALYFLIKDAIKPAMLVKFKEECESLISEVLPKKTTLKQFKQEMKAFLEDYERFEDEMEIRNAKSVQQETELIFLTSQLEQKIHQDYQKSQANLMESVEQKEQCAEQINCQVDDLSDRMDELTNTTGSVASDVEAFASDLSCVAHESEAIKRMGIELCKKV